MIQLCPPFPQTTTSTTHDGSQKMYSFRCNQRKRWTSCIRPVLWFKNKIEVTHLSWMNLFTVSFTFSLGQRSRAVSPSLFFASGSARCWIKKHAIFVRVSSFSFDDWPRSNSNCRGRNNKVILMYSKKAKRPRITIYTIPDPRRLEQWSERVFRFSWVTLPFNWSGEKVWNDSSTTTLNSFK